jgi:hypothetical protein
LQQDSAALVNALPDAEPLTDSILAFSVDVSALLPAGWENEVSACSATHSRWQLLDGASVTSREADFRDSAPPRVGVVTGDVIAEQLPWLDQLYRTTFLDLVNSVGAGDYEVGVGLRACININATPRDARYEWHVDSNPITALLFVTSHGPEQGGQLIFRPDPVARPNEDWQLQVSPRSGTLLLFDAREAAHVVTRLNTDLRLSVPMNYYFVGQQQRPEDLDDYLYS